MVTSGISQIPWLAPRLFNSMTSSNSVKSWLGMLVVSLLLVSSGGVVGGVSGTALTVMLS